MADGEITISELELSEELLGDMVLPVETSTDTKSATLAQLRSWLGTSLPVGSIFASVGKIDDARFTLLDGKTLSATGTYAEFYLKAVEKVQAGKWQRCTEEEFNQDISNYGQCGKFVISNDYVRIPKLTRFIGATNNIAEIGSTYGESLPNIKGSITSDQRFRAYSGGEYSGAFKAKEVKNTYTSTANSSTEAVGVDFDASWDSPTYKDNAKVQPDHTKYFYYMVISTAGQTEPVDIDINQVYEDMELKANKDFSNVDNVSQSFKKASVSWGIPDYNAGIQMTYPDSSHKFTAPEDGICVLFNYWMGANNFTTDTILYINDIETSFRGQSGGSYYENGNGTIIAPLKKGDVIYLSRGARSVRKNIFYPLKGVN